MTPAQLTSYVRLKTKTSATTFTDANIMLLANIFIDDFATRVIKVNEDYFGTPQTTGLVADQREYPQPVETLNQIKYVEAKLDATNFIHLDELDLNSYERATTESVITSLYSNNEGEAFYDLFRGSLWIYSGTITTVAAGLKIWSFDWPAHITDLTSTTDMSKDPSTTTHGFPRALHELLCRRIVIEHKEMSDKPIALTTSEQKFAMDLDDVLDSMQPASLDRETVGKMPGPNEEGDSGYNY